MYLYTTHILNILYIYKPIILLQIINLKINYI